MRAVLAILRFPSLHFAGEKEAPPPRHPPDAKTPLHRRTHTWNRACLPHADDAWARPKPQRLRDSPSLAFPIGHCGPSASWLRIPAESIHPSDALSPPFPNGTLPASASSVTTAPSSRRVPAASQFQGAVHIIAYSAQQFKQQIKFAAFCSCFGDLSLRNAGADPSRRWGQTPRDRREPWSGFAFGWGQTPVDGGDRPRWTVGWWREE